MSRSGLHGCAARIVSTSHTSNGCSAWDYLGALLVCYVQPSTFYLHQLTAVFMCGAKDVLRKALLLLLCVVHLARVSSMATAHYGPRVEPFWDQLKAGLFATAVATVRLCLWCCMLLAVARLSHESGVIMSQVQSLSSLSSRSALGSMHGA